MDEACPQEKSFETLRALYEKTKPELSSLKNAEDKKTSVYFESTVNCINEMIEESTINSETYIKLLAMKSSLIYEKAKMLLSKQNIPLSINTLKEALQTIEDFKLNPQITYLYFRIMNQLAYFLSKSDQLEEAKNLLEDAENLYNTITSKQDLLLYNTDEIFKNTYLKKGTNILKFEKLVTNNLQIQGWIYNKMNLGEKFIEYHHTVLKRQLETEDGNAFTWIFKCARLGSYFFSNQRFQEARHHLAASCAVLREYEMDLLKYRSEPHFLAEWENLQRYYADMGKYWIKYGLFLFDASRRSSSKASIDEALDSLLITSFDKPNQQSTEKSDKATIVLSQTLTTISETDYFPNNESLPQMLPEMNLNDVEKTKNKEDLNTTQNVSESNETNINETEITVSSLNENKELPDDKAKIGENSTEKSSIPQAENPKTTAPENESKEVMTPDEGSRSTAANEELQNVSALHEASKNTASFSESSNITPNKDSETATSATDSKNVTITEESTGITSDEDSKDVTLIKEEQHLTSAEEAKNFTADKEEVKHINSDESKIETSTKESQLKCKESEKTQNASNPKRNSMGLNDSLLLENDKFIEENTIKTPVVSPTFRGNDKMQPKSAHTSKYNFVFPSLQLRDFETQVSADFIRTKEDARALFLYIQEWLKRSKSFYTVQEYTVEYVNLILDLNELYCHLAAYETDLDNQYNVQKRRVDLLEMLSSIMKELKPQHYVAISIELLHELSQAQIELLDLNVRRLCNIQHMNSPSPELAVRRDEAMRKMEALNDIRKRLGRTSSLKMSAMDIHHHAN